MRAHHFDKAVSIEDAKVYVKECFWKMLKAPNITPAWPSMSPRCHSIPWAGKLLRPADFGNVIVLREGIQVSVEVLGKPRKKSPCDHSTKQGTRDMWHHSPPLLHILFPLSEPALSKPPNQASQPPKPCPLPSVTPGKLGKPLPTDTANSSSARLQASGPSWDHVAQPPPLV